MSLLDLSEGEMSTQTSDKVTLSEHQGSSSNIITLQETLPTRTQLLSEYQGDHGDIALAFVLILATI